MTAAARLAALDNLPAEKLYQLVEDALTALVDVMNQETILLRAGHLREASVLTPAKTQLAQEYVGFARAVQRQTERLKREAPEGVERLRHRHEALATQMAENLRVLATARNITEHILTDVAQVVGQHDRTRAYGRAGTITADPSNSARGIAVNRAM